MLHIAQTNEETWMPVLLSINNFFNWSKITLMSHIARKQLKRFECQFHCLQLISVSIDAKDYTCVQNSHIWEFLMPVLLPRITIITSAVTCIISEHRSTTFSDYRLWSTSHDI